jgi:hypothetical protein
MTKTSLLGWAGWIGGAVGLCGLTFELARCSAGRVVPSVVAAHRAPIEPSEPPVPAAPELPGEVLALKASPDGTRAALVTGDGRLQFVCLVDLNTPGLLAQRRIPGEASPRIYWSPSSRRAAIVNESGEILFLQRDGSLLSSRRAPGDLHAGSLYTAAWRPDRPEVFAFVRAERPTVVIEFNVDNRETTETDVGHGVISLFPVRDRLCFSFSQRLNDPAPSRWEHGTFEHAVTVLLAAGVADRKPFLRVPLLGVKREYWEFNWDYLDLTVSPDGRYCYFLWGGSGTLTYAIGRTKDAGRILWEPQMALAYELESASEYQVDWPTEGARPVAVVSSRPQPFLFAVDLVTGSRRMFADPTIRRLEMVPHGLELAVTEAGLVQNGASILWYPGEVLLSAP